MLTSLKMPSSSSLSLVTLQFSPLAWYRAKMSNLAPILNNHVFCCTGLSAESKVRNNLVKEVVTEQFFLPKRQFIKGKLKRLVVEWMRLPVKLVIVYWAVRKPSFNPRNTW